MGLGNQIKKNKQEATKPAEPKMIAVPMTELNWRILIGTLELSKENVGKFSIDSSEIGIVHANCNAFINVIGSAIGADAKAAKNG